MLLGVAYLREIAERQVWGAVMTEKKPTLTIVAGREPRCRLPRSESVAGHTRPRPEALGWQKITNDWRERARAETFVRLSACLHEVRKSLSSHSARRAQPSSTPLWQRLNVIMTKWRGLIQIARNPYRPELHYMRGPGPKSYAKYQGHTENGPL